MQIFPEDRTKLLTTNEVKLRARGIDDELLLREILPLVHQNKKLQVLDLRRNNIKARGAIELANSLTTPITLRLSFNDIGKEGFDALLENKNIIFCFEQNYYTPTQAEKNQLWQRRLEATERLSTEPSVLQQSQISSDKSSVGHQRNSFFSTQSTVAHSSLKGLVINQAIPMIEGGIGKTRLAVKLSMYEAAKKRAEVAQRVHGETADNPYIAEALHGLGIACGNLGEHQLQKNYHEQSLMMKKRIYGETADHPNIAGSLYELGVVCGNLEEHTNQKHYYEQALEMMQSVYSKSVDHPDIAVVLHGLGVVSGILEDYPKQKKYYEQSLAMKSRIYGDKTNHPNIAVTLFNLGIMYKKELYETDNAILCLQKAHEMYLRMPTFGSKHPLTIKAESELEVCKKRYSYKP